MRKRLEKLEKLLASSGGEVYLYRVPGRVNLIGEHIDYNHCPVLPLAIDREILALVRLREDNRITAVDTKEGFPRVEFAISSQIEPFEGGHWGNYIKAGVQGVIDEWPKIGCRGFDLAIDSNIPFSAGLSSSSALVVLAALVFLGANGVKVTSKEERLVLAEACARGERYTGTQGGGMDQAAILLGEEDHALLINFNPLRSESLPLPKDYTLVVANSLVEAPKTRSAMDAYNRRSIESRLATELLSHALKMEYGRGAIEFIGEVQDPPANLFEVVKNSPYSVSEIAKQLQLAEDEVVKRWIVRKDGSPLPVPPEGFLLAMRLQHILEEWERVKRSAQALRKGAIEELGELINASHASCRDLFEISCPELDTLVEINRRAGAIGSRLTGAGFGGCTLSLVPTSLVPSFLKEVGEHYYRSIMGRSSWEEALFPVRGVRGASVLEI
ncbi:MAG: galactokinase [Sphaerochaetaceae bacterium]